MEKNLSHSLLAMLAMVLVSSSFAMQRPAGADRTTIESISNHMKGKIFINLFSAEGEVNPSMSATVIHPGENHKMNFLLTKINTISISTPNGVYHGAGLPGRKSAKIYFIPYDICENGTEHKIEGRQARIIINPDGSISFGANQMVPIKLI